MSAAPHDWLAPDWPAPARVRAVCTTRSGGVSAAPFDTLNLGDHVGDRPDDVACNRSYLQAALGARPVFLKQVHGADVAELSLASPDGVVADACGTAVPGVACTIMVADCLPVLFTNPQGTWVAAAHAGWRGLSGESGSGVLEAVVASCPASGPAKPARSASKVIADGQAPEALLAWLGPCIGPTAFEVGPEVRAAFCDVDPQAARHFTPQPAPGKYLADLAGLARQRLQRLGVASVTGNDGTAAWCTVAPASRFFSHRRDTARLGSSGRFAACVWIDGAPSG